MEVTIDGQKISYLDVGKGKTVLLLHGWAVFLNKEKYWPLIDLLKANFRVVAIDFPGFGGSQPPKSAWEIKDFAKMVDEFIKKKGLKVEAVIGHSFGGRVAMKMAVEYENDFRKLILIDSAGIERKNLKVAILTWLGSRLPSGFKAMGKKLRSKDYQETSGIMREVMKKVVAEDQEQEMRLINKPTLIVWGDEDHTTPLWQAKIINKAIKKSILEVVKGNHGLPYKNPEVVSPVISKFLTK